MMRPSLGKTVGWLAPIVDGGSIENLQHKGAQPFQILSQGANLMAPKKNAAYAYCCMNQAV